MTEEMKIECGPPEKSGRRLVITSLDGASHRDRFDTDSDYHRRKFREAVADKFSLPEESHQWLENEIVRVADLEDQRVEEELDPVRKPILIKLSDVEPRQTDWLWPNRVAKGRITLLVGMPGVGKSFFTCDTAARVSTGSPWPDGTPCPHGSVILISAEDDPADTIRPRLDTHSADVSKIELLAGTIRTDDEGTEKELMFSLSDLDALEVALQQVSDCRLIVVDPIGSFLGGGTDAHRDNEVRAVLAPLAKLAEKYGPAVLIVAHRRKGGGGTADELALGSRAFTGIARSVWHLSADPDSGQRRLLLPGKNNLAAQQQGLAFTISGEPAALRWERDPVAMTADEALAREIVTRGHSSALDEAVAWLEDRLANGPKPGKELKEAAAADGITSRTLDRARSKLYVICGPDGFRGPWVWRLPDTTRVCQEASLTQCEDSDEMCDNEDTGGW